MAALHIDLDEIGQRESLHEIAAVVDIIVNHPKTRLDHRCMAQLPLIKQFSDELMSLPFFIMPLFLDDTEFNELKTE